MTPARSIVVLLSLSLGIVHAQSTAQTLAQARVTFDSSTPPASAGIEVDNAKHDVELLPGSRLWIEGTTSINSFDCHANRIYLRSNQLTEVTPSPPNQPTGSTNTAEATGLITVQLDTVEAQIEIPIMDLDCGRSRMNKDLQKAMKAEVFPRINYRLSGASGTNSEDGTDPTILTARGLLTVAGVQQRVHVQATAESLDNGDVRVTGSLPLNMSDYSVIPPRLLRGLIRVRNEIVVQFDLKISVRTSHN